MLRVLLHEVTIEEDVAWIAGKKNWSFVGIRGPTEQSYERIWLAADQSTYVHYVEDRNLGVRYLALNGEGAESLAASLRSQLPVHDRDSVLRMANEAIDRDSKIRAVYAAGAFSSIEFDRGLFGVFERMLRDSDAEVRRAAIFASSYPAWREFRPPLESLREHDPDPEVRHLAATALSSMEEHVWRTS